MLIWMMWACTSPTSGLDPSAPEELQAVEQPGPTLALDILARDVNHAVAVTTNEADVYWGDGPKLMRRAKSGGDTREVVVLDAVSIESIAVTKTHIFAGTAGGGLFRIGLENLKAERIASGRYVNDLTVVGDELWFNSQGIQHISLGAPGGAAPPVYFAMGYLGSVAVGGEQVYLHNNSNLIQVAPRMQPLDSEPIAFTGRFGVSMASDDHHLYWGDETTGVVMRRAHGEGALELVHHEFGIGDSLTLRPEEVLIVSMRLGLTRVRKRDLHHTQHAADGSGPASFGSVNGTRVMSDGTAAYVAVVASTFDMALPKLGGLPHLDLTKPDAKMPAVRHQGFVARLSMDIEDVIWEAPVGSVELATVYFREDSARAQDWGNATYFLRQRGARLGDAIRFGTLPLRLVGRQERIDATAAHLRRKLGNDVVLVMETSDADTVEIRADGAAYAKLWGM